MGLQQRCYGVLGRAMWPAALLVAVLLAAHGTPASGQSSSPANGCAAILKAGVYKSMYDKADAGPYAAFEDAVCSLPSNNLNELVLPLGASQQADFSTAAAALVPLWSSAPGSFDSLGFSTSNAYRVVRDFHTATCKVGYVCTC